MLKLKELISLFRFLSQQEKNNEINWGTEVKLESKIVIKKHLGNVLSENWKKIRHVAPDWSGFLWSESLIKQIAKSGKTIENNSRIFGRDGDDRAFQSEDALCHLQSIINDDFLSTIEYKEGEVFKLEEWKNDDLKEWKKDDGTELDVEVVISISAQKVQELLNRSYSEDEMKELDISNKNLIGELDLSELPNLEKLDCSHNQITSLKLSKGTNLLYLDCSHNQLKGKLDLTGNDKLTGLDCSFNELEELVIDKCSNLKMLVCNDNRLKNNLKVNLLDNLNPNELVCLNISDNNLQGNLDDFKDFTSLELLWIGSEDKSKKGIRNEFTGSLKSLKDMKKLDSLNISNSGIDVDGYYDCLYANEEMQAQIEIPPE